MSDARPGSTDASPQAAGDNRGSDASDTVADAFTPYDGGRPGAEFDASSSEKPADADLHDDGGLDAAEASRDASGTGPADAASTDPPDAALARDAALGPDAAAIRRDASARGDAVAPLVDAGIARPEIDWVSLRGGQYLRGSNNGRPERETPILVVNVPAFEVSRTEVTVAQYSACVTAGACRPPIDCDTGTPNWGVPGRDDHPINCVSWTDAQDFVGWLGDGARLPTEAEWEYAARGEGRPVEYPWGDERATCARAIMLDPAAPPAGCGADATWPVCSRPDGSTPQGLCDMAGNVREWVEDWYGSYTDAPIDGSARDEPAQNRSHRGGGWRGDWSNQRASNRTSSEPAWRDDYLGFRVAR